MFYAAADIAFVGGSLEAVGGHNLLEPAALGLPVLVGPHTFNFAGVTESLIHARAALRVADDEALGSALISLLSREQERLEMGAAAHAVLERERGAVERTLVIVEQVLAGQPVQL